jgi:hypothetical protein
LLLLLGRGALRGGAQILDLLARRGRVLARLRRFHARVGGLLTRARRLIHRRRGLLSRRIGLLPRLLRVRDLLLLADDRLAVALRLQRRVGVRQHDRLVGGRDRCWTGQVAARQRRAVAR